MFFTKPFDLDNIDRILREDSRRFTAASFLVIGLSDRFDSAVEQLKELFEAYAAAGRDDSPLYKLFDLMADHCFGRDLRPERIQQFAEALGFGDLSSRIRAPMYLAQLNPEERAREENRQWMRNYYTTANTERDEREAAQQQQALKDAISKNKGQPPREGSP